MSDFAPSDATMPAGTAHESLPPVALSPLDAVFGPEKERVDAPPPSAPKHEFELEDRRHTDWPRRRAIVIDNLILIGVFYVLDAALRGYIAAGAFTTALALTYFFVAEATTGQTIGKRMSGLRVVMRDGRPAPANAVAARTVLRLIDVLPAAWILGGLSMLITGGRRQRLGDLAAGTVVRRDDRPMPRAPHSPLLGVYPVLWIGMALALMWHVNLLTPHAEVRGRLTSDPYMRKVNDICRRRVESELAFGDRVTIDQALRVAELEFGAIASLPKPPRESRAAYGTVMRIERSGIRRAHRIVAMLAVGNGERASAELESLRRFGRRADRRFTELGLPHCAH